MGGRNHTASPGKSDAASTADAMLLAAFVIILAFFGWQGLTDDQGALRPEQDHTITLSLSRELVATGDYHRDFVYPLPAVVAKLALGALGTRASSLVWMGLMLSSALACVLAMARLMPGRSGRGRYAAPLLGALAIVYCLRWDFRAVNANTVLLALALWGFVLLGRGRDAGGGALLAASVGLKLYAAPLVGLLVVQRRWRAVAWTLGWLFVAFGVVPVLWFGVADAIALTGRWFARLSEAGAVDSAMQITAYNVSLLRGVSGVLDADSSAPSSAALWLSRGLGLGFSAAVFAWLVVAVRSAGPRSLDARALTGIGLVLGAVLLLSPIAQPHHGVMLWPLASAAAGAALDPSGPRRRRVACAALLAAAALALVAAPSGVGKAVALACATLLMAVGAVLGGVPADLRRAGRPARSAEPVGEVSG